MPNCSFCEYANPPGIDRCQKCGAWLEQKTEYTASAPSKESVPAIEPGSLDAQVLALLQNNQKIEAIKVYREQTGCGLKDAKDAVEALARKHGISPKGSGCARVVLLMLLVCTKLGFTVWLTLA